MLIFWAWATCGLGELIFAIRTDWFFLLLINCCDFQRVQEKIIIDNTFVFIEYLRVMVNDTYFQTINDVLTIHSVLSWCLPYTTIKTIAFLNLSFDYHNIFGHWLFWWSIESDLILSSIIKFELQSAYSRVNFCGTNVCGNPFLVGIL